MLMKQFNTNLGPLKITSDYSGKRTMSLNNIVISTDHEDSSERYLAEFTLSRIELENPKILVVGLGLGNTVDEVIKYGNENFTEYTLDVIEYLPDVISIYKKPNEVNEIINDDFYQILLEQRELGVYDVIIIDVDDITTNPYHPRNSMFYNGQLMKTMRDNYLSEKGVFSLWTGETVPNEKIMTAINNLFSYQEVYPYKLNVQNFNHTVHLYLGKK